MFLEYKWKKLILEIAGVSPLSPLDNSYNGNLRVPPLPFSNLNLNFAHTAVAVYRISMKSIS
jgi:hypothetical protein